MDTIPSEIILLIFELIPKITDKRQFLRTCNKYNILTKESMKNFENNYVVKHFHKINGYHMEKFTLELCHDKYFDMIPEHYIIPRNFILVKALATFNCVELLQVIMKRNILKTMIMGKRDSILSEVCQYFVLSQVCEHAANNGSLEVLKWGENSGFNLGIVTYNSVGTTVFTNICANAALNGHLNVLNWAKEIGLIMDDMVCSNAALGGHVEILNWAKLNGLHWDMLVTASNAARGGNIEVLKWVKANGGKWNNFSVGHAAKNGHLEALQWLHNDGCVLERITCGLAAGHLEVLKWLHEIGCPWDETTCENAARAGNLDSLKYARENGCPWDEWTYLGAIDNDHKEIVNWAIENGCPTETPENMKGVNLFCINGQL